MFLWPGRTVSALCCFTGLLRCTIFFKLTCLFSVSEGLEEGGARRDAIHERASIGLEYWGNASYGNQLESTATKLFS